jgi:hypothetical protein
MLAKSGVRRNALHRRSSRWSGRLLLAIVMAVVLLLSQPAHPTRANPDTTVDGFDVTQSVYASGDGDPYPNPNSGYADGATNLLGGQRDVIVTVTGGNLELNVDITDSELAHSQKSGVKGTTQVQWDGDDGGATSVDPNGLGSSHDLTNSGSDNAFIIGLIAADENVDVTITFYDYSADSISTCSKLTKTLPKHDSDDPARVVVFPFGAFGTGDGCTTAAQITDVGALTLFIDGSASEARDVTIDLLKTGIVDYGDLPGAGPDYASTLLEDDGAGHVVGSSLYLGSSIDGEADGQESSNADGDDNGDTDDEDGVAPTLGVTWQQGANGGSVDVTVVGDGCLNGWIDWDQDGTFEEYDAVWDDNEYVIQNKTGSGTYTFDVPVDPSGETFYARFRVFPELSGGGCATQTPAIGDKVQYLSGEVEDYEWTFSPTAVTLTRLDAISVPSRSPVGAVAAMLACLTGSVAIGGALMRRRQAR